uniref:Uncharacterized protein n=1 Tax=Arundo donax TaxID=35708 RepID=A0A0A8ZAP3_ARUDO
MPTDMNPVEINELLRRRLLDNSLTLRGLTLPLEHSAAVAKLRIMIITLVQGGVSVI